MFKNALEMAEEIGDLNGVGIWLRNIAEVYALLKQKGTAISFLKKSIAVAKQTNNQKALKMRESLLVSFESDVI